MTAPLHTLSPQREPGRSRPNKAAVRQAFTRLIEALGITEQTDAQTAQRATSLWLEHLLASEHGSVDEALGPGLASEQNGPILLEPMGFHLVCPHHLTIAAGNASVAFWPAGRIVGFGRLQKLVHAATAQVALQEVATSQIAQTIMRALAPRAVAVRLRAEHLCHTVLHPRAHNSQATSWGLLGEPDLAVQLQRLLHP